MCENARQMRTVRFYAVRSERRIISRNHRHAGSPSEKSNNKIDSAAWWYPFYGAIVVGNFCDLVNALASEKQKPHTFSVPVYAVAVVADCPKSYIRGRLYPCRKRTARGKRKIIKIQIHRLAAPSFKLCYHCTPVRRICQYPLFTKRSGTLQAFPGKYGRKTLISGCFASMEAYPFTKQR